ncbi:MAG: nuclear transport factor 2 family protein [Novosphingobium sp.]|nr:nuclear transport factor 2 family protein [Novosphingobium sp.]
MLETRDIVDIQQLEAFCHHAVDHEDQSLLHLAFTEDARFDGRLCGGPLCEGLDAIIDFFALGKPPHPPAHHMTNCWVYEDGDTVRVKMKWMVPDPESGRMYGGVNDDIVVRTEDGWRIQERIATAKYPGMLGGGEATAEG